MIQLHLKAVLLAAALLTPLSGNTQPPTPTAATPLAATSILDTVHRTGTLQCGVVREEEDYSKASVHGNRAAFDIDICKAVATAVLGAKARTVFHAFPDEPAALRALRSGQVQLIATATPGLINQTAQGISFSPVVFFDGEGFLVKKGSSITSPKDLAGKKVCFIDQTSNVENLTAYAARENVKLIPFPFEEEGEMEAAMYTGNCAAMTTDITQLANTRARFNVRAREFDLLPQTISLDPLAVATLQTDAQWSAVVSATISAIIQAEESGITAANIEKQRDDSTDPAVPAYFGSKSTLGTLLHLDSGWAVRVVESVGNYGEMYERDLGAKSPLQIPRGTSELWSHGGMLYAPPLGNR